MCQVSVILPFSFDINDQKIKESSGLDNVQENVQFTTNILFLFYILHMITYMFLLTIKTTKEKNLIIYQSKYCTANISMFKV